MAEACHLYCCLHLMSAHGSATADASVMAPSPLAVGSQSLWGCGGGVESVGSGGALSQEVVLLVVVLSPASPSPGGGAVGGGAAACSPTVSQEEEEVVCTSGAVPATASGPFAHLTRAPETLASSRDTFAWRCSS